MPKTWKCATGVRFELHVTLLDQTAGSFGATAVCAGAVVPELNRVATLSDCTWSYPALAGDTDITVAVDQFNGAGPTAQFDVEVRQGGVVVECRLNSFGGPINGPPGGPFSGVPETAPKAVGGAMFALAVMDLP